MGNSGLEPTVVLRASKRDEFSVPVGDLENEVFAPAVLLAVNVDKAEHSPDRTEERVFGRCQRYEVLTGTELVIFRLFNRYDDAVADVTPQRLDVLPEHDHLEVDVVGSLGNHVARTKHRQVVEKGELLEHMDGGVSLRRIMWR